MTTIKYIDCGVERERDVMCIECAAWISGDKEIFGLCNDEASDHYGHILDQSHPKCKEG